MAGGRTDWNDDDDDDDLDRLFQSSQTDNARLEWQMSSSSRSRRQNGTLQPARQPSRRNLQPRERPSTSSLPNTARQTNPSTSRARALPEPSTGRSESSNPSKASSRTPSTSTTRTPSHRMQTRISSLESSFNQSENAEDVNRAALQQRITSGRQQVSLRSQSRSSNPTVLPSSSRELQAGLKKSTPKTYVVVKITF